MKTLIKKVKFVFEGLRPRSLAIKNIHPLIPDEYYLKSDPYWGRTRIATEIEYR